MKLRRNILTVSLMGALALGVWGLAVSFTAFNFSDGDTLSAAALNDALNANFSAAEAAITALEAKVAALESATPVDITELEARVAELETASLSLPIAFGYVTGGAANVYGTDNFGVTYNAAQGRYEISIDDHSYFIQSSYAFVSVLGNRSSFATTGSVSGDLLVYVHDEDGNPDPSASFTFVAFKKP